MPLRLEVPRLLGGALGGSLGGVLGGALGGVLVRLSAAL